MYNYFKNNDEFSLNLIQSLFLFVDFDMQYYMVYTQSLKLNNGREMKQNIINVINRKKRYDLNT